MVLIFRDRRKRVCSLIPIIRGREIIRAVRQIIEAAETVAHIILRWPFTFCGCRGTRAASDSFWRCLNYCEESYNRWEYIDIVVV